MSDLNLSKVEIPLKSKSMSNQESPKTDIISIKQIGDYILGEEIGSGAFGKVLLGKHILTEEKVAIKILDKMILNETPEDYELVKKEISILKIVKHKYIVQLYEIMQTAQHIFIIMEYCEGKEILDYILRKNKLSELESLKYFQQLINCLFYLHSQNITHRDIKIDNMLLDGNKDLKLIDFGLSTKYTDDDLLDQPCGTVVYAAPEVLEGKEYHGMLADVWSSGIVLYGMLSGYLPFSEKDDEKNKQLVIKGKITMPDFFSDQVKDLLKHMLDVNPMTRYTLQEIKDHPWFNLVDSLLIPGIIINYNIIPIDEKVIDICVATYNKDRNDVINSIRNNKHDSNYALYYLLIKKLFREGVSSISDMCSDEFIDFVLDENNLINNENNNNKEEISNDNSNIKNNEILIKTDSNNDKREFIERDNDTKKEILIENYDENPKNIQDKLSKENEKNTEEKNDDFIYYPSSQEKNNKDKYTSLESSDEFKNTNSHIAQKNYDIDEPYINKDNNFDNNEKIELKNSLINQEEIQKINEKEKLNDKNENLFEQISLDEERRLNTETTDCNRIIEKIMKNLEFNANKNKFSEINISKEIIENNIKGENNLKIEENQEISIKRNNLKENEDTSIQKDIPKMLNNEENSIKINLDAKLNKKEILEEISNIEKPKNIIKDIENINSPKQKTETPFKKRQEKKKKFDKNKEKYKNKNKYTSSATKKKYFFNEKSNNILRKLKMNLIKQNYNSPKTHMTEMKTEKKKAKIFSVTKNGINKGINNIKEKTNFSSRNSKTKNILVNNKKKVNLKKLPGNSNFSDFKRKATNKIFNIINIINNNFNSTENEIKMKNYYQSPQKIKENINIANLQKKFDVIYDENIKDIYNGGIVSDKNLSLNKKENERIVSKPNEQKNCRTNNITIIIQNKKGIDKNNLNGNLLNSIINFDNKNIINLNNSKIKNKNNEINDLESKRKKPMRTKNLESSVKQNNRYKSPMDVRNLSESPKQKYLNYKTRLNRIPWKIKKNAIDKKIDSKQIYAQYKSKISNPFTQNNSKIVNMNQTVKNSFSNSLINNLNNTRKINKSSFENNFNKIRSSNISPKNIKQISNNKNICKAFLKRRINSRVKLIKNHSKIKDNKIFNSNSKIKEANINSLFSMSNILNNINNTDYKKTFFHIKKSSGELIHNNTLSVNLKNKFNKSKDEYDNIYMPLNLSCLFFKKCDLNSYKNYLLNKLKRNSISFIQKKNNYLICNKNGYNCEIQINKVKDINKNLYSESGKNDNNLEEKDKMNLYYMKI